MLNINFAIFFIISLLANSCKQAVPDKPIIVDPIIPNASIQAKIITQGLNNPWELLWGADGKLWMTERGGRISRVDTGTGTVTSVLTIADVKSTGEGGLLGMVLHPNFTSTPHVFVAYNYDKNGAYTEKVSRSYRIC